MRSLRYLNTILTVLTVLLALQLWTSWTSARDNAATSFASTAQADSSGGIPDGGAQRKEMIDLLKRQIQATESLANLFNSGQARVRVESAPNSGK